MFQKENFHKSSFEKECFRYQIKSFSQQLSWVLLKNIVNNLISMDSMENRTWYANMGSRIFWFSKKVPFLRICSIVTFIFKKIEDFKCVWDPVLDQHPQTMHSNFYSWKENTLE